MEFLDSNLTSTSIPVNRNLIKRGIQVLGVINRIGEIGGFSTTMGSRQITGEENVSRSRTELHGARHIAEKSKIGESKSY